MDRDRSKFWPLLGAVLLAVMVRVPVAAWRVDSLGDDRDHYRLLADGLIEGNGLVHPDHGTPTAYRPPLYPLVLAAVAWTTGAGDLGVAALHLALFQSRPHKEERFLYIIYPLVRCGMELHAAAAAAAE